VIIDSFIGRYVLVRSHEAGVHAGVLDRYERGEALLSKAKRLWYWIPGERLKWLSGVAEGGLATGSRLGCELPQILIGNVCEVIPCSDRAARSIKSYPHERA